MSPRAPLMAACLAVIMFAGCSSTDFGSPSPSATTPSQTATSAAPTPTASRIPTWSAEQALAIAAVDDFQAASERIGSNPAGFTVKQMTALLGKSAGGEVVTSAVTAYTSLKKRGLRYDGTTVVLSTDATKASDVGYGTEVIVTRCIDQRDLRVHDESGRVLTDDQLGYVIPEFNLRQFTVQKHEGSRSFLVYGMATVKGECDS